MKECETNWGLAAIGRCADVSIDVDEAVSGPERWQMSIDLPQFQFRFTIPAPAIVGGFCDFLQQQLNHKTTGELPLGTLGNADVSIIKDDEFMDRFFLLAAADGGAVRHTLTGDVVINLIVALRQVASDLDG